MKEDEQYKYKGEYKDKYKERPIRLDSPKGLSHTDCPKCFSPIAEGDIQAEGHVCLS